MTIRWTALLIGFVAGGILANVRTGGGKVSGDGTVAPTDQNKKAGWSQ